MVNIGTIFSLAALGAVAVGGYALYRNSGKIGDIVTSGIQKSVFSPIDNYFDSMSKSIGTNPSGKSQTSKLAPKNKANPSYNEYAKGNDMRSQQQVNEWYKKNNVVNPNSENRVAAIGVAAPGVAAPTPSQRIIVPKESKAGYYYQNFAPGGRTDRQLKLKKGTADKLRSRGYDLTFLTPSQKLSEPSFNLFGKSKGFL